MLGSASGASYSVTPSCPTLSIPPLFPRSATLLAPGRVWATGRVRPPGRSRGHGNLAIVPARALDTAHYFTEDTILSTSKRSAVGIALRSLPLLHSAMEMHRSGNLYWSSCLSLKHSHGLKCMCRAKEMQRTRRDASKRELVPFKLPSA